MNDLGMWLVMATLFIAILYCYMRSGNKGGESPWLFGFIFTGNLGPCPQEIAL